MTYPDIAYVDIDGVLADDRHRTAYALKRQWAEYFNPERVILDGVWAEGAALVRDLRKRGTEVNFMTGRREDLRPVTEQWLKIHGFFDPETTGTDLHMRPFDDPRRLPMLKADMLSGLQAVEPEETFVLYDDDPEVIRVVGERFGADAVEHCTWHIKPEALVRRATA